MTAQFDMFADDATPVGRRTRLDGRATPVMNEDEMVISRQRAAFGS